MSKLILGIDFDNTLVSYDEIFSKIALEWNLLPDDGTLHTKQSIRDYVRASGENGELQWQKMQVLAYGMRILEALPSKGVLSFLEKCAVSNIPIFVVSHKTEFATYEGTPINLRKAAIKWFEKHNLFSRRYDLSEKNVFFEPTRAKKVIKIQKLKCTHFIDDLVETFLEKQFPAHVEKLLYAHRDSITDSVNEILFFSEWGDIESYFFEIL